MMTGCAGMPTISNSHDRCARPPAGRHAASGDGSRRWPARADRRRRYIAGRGRRRGHRARGRRVVLFPIRGWADPAPVEKYPHCWLALAQVGRFLRRARAEGCRDVAFIGTAVRPPFRSLRVDWEMFRLLPRVVAHVSRRRRSSALGCRADVRGLRLPDRRRRTRWRRKSSMPEGPIGSVAPSGRDRADIARALALLQRDRPFDVGQAAVVADNHVLAVEAAEGTDGMLARVAELRARGRIPTPAGSGVLVKAAKAQSGPPRRSADHRSAYRRGSGARRACRHRDRGGRSDYRRTARGGGGGRRGEDLRLRHRQAAMRRKARPLQLHLDRGGRVRRRARRRTDGCAAAAACADVAFGGVGGRAMGTRASSARSISPTCRSSASRRSREASAHPAPYPCRPRTRWWRRGRTRW